MLSDKVTKVFSEISDFFTSSEQAIFNTIDIYKAINLERIKLISNQHHLQQYAPKEIFLFLLLFPLFSVKNVKSYLDSSLKHYLEAEKDTLYRFKNDSFINWRGILWSIVQRLVLLMEEKGASDTASPKCLIVDDSDLPKTGLKIEHVSKIFSHVLHRRLLGFKLLLLGYWDSKSFIGLDFSLHKEKGNNKKYLYGLKPKHRKAQYKKKRDSTSYGYKRERELNKNKIDVTVSMIKRAIRKGLAVDYILMDSWFICDKIIKCVEGLNKGIFVLAMGKMGKNKYELSGKEYTAKELAHKLKKEKKEKYHKTLGAYGCEAVVNYKGTKLKLFFSKYSKRGKQYLLVTTNLSLSFLKAIEIYSIRWGIEVFFKEAKQHFGLGKSQSRDFDAQVADTTICIIQYNVFSLAKRFSAYETLGGLFANSQEAIKELTICRKLWGLMLEIIRQLADLFEVDCNELIPKLIQDNNENKILNLLQQVYLDAA